MKGVASRAAVAALGVFAVGAAAALLVVLLEVWLLVFAGLLVAVLLSASAESVARRTRWSRGPSLAVVLASLAFVLWVAARLLWPAIATQADELVTRLPAAWEQLRGWLDDRPLGAWLVEHATEEDVVEPTSVVTRATGAIMTSVAALGGLLVVLFVGIYVAAEPESYRGGLRRLLPTSAHRRFDDVTRETAQVLRWWLVGKLVSMTIVGILTTAGLWLLGVPLALVFGLMAMALTFVPNIGPILSVVPPALLALTDAPWTALYVVGLYLGIQTVESYGITPLIQRRTVSLPPALTIVAQLALGLLAGALGVAVATPLTAVAVTAVRVLYLDDGDQDA